MSKIDLKSVKILPWSGKEEDWKMWSTKFKMRARAHGYYGVLVSKQVDLTDQDMKKKNDEGYMDLIMSISDHKSFNAVIQYEDDLRQAWIAL